MSIFGFIFVHCICLVKLCATSQNNNYTTTVCRKRVIFSDHKSFSTTQRRMPAETVVQSLRRSSKHL